jgi:RNA polymerase sigma-70 factor, ECF subfamily
MIRGASVGPMPVPVAASAAAIVPVPAAGGPVDGVAFGAGGLGQGVRGRAAGPVRDGAAGRELPDGLLAGAVRGDGRARDELLALLHPWVLGYCRARLGRRESVLCSAEDVAQDVCVAVLRALGGYQLKGLSFPAFVYGIAAHKVADAFRVIGRGDRCQPVAELPDTAAVTADGPEQRVLDNERSVRLGALLAHLSPRQREVLVLRVAMGAAAEETAQLVGSTAGAVRVSQHRAMRQLRQIIQEGESSTRPLLRPSRRGLGGPQKLARGPAAPTNPHHQGSSASPGRRLVDLFP